MVPARMKADQPRMRSGQFLPVTRMMNAQRAARRPTGPYAFEDKIQTFEDSRKRCWAKYFFIRCAGECYSKLDSPPEPKSAREHTPN